jgi:hypothetical protein
MLITLTTDFGTADGYVGAMKGVIARLAPEAQVVDITHEIPAQDILAGALALETACPFFPPETIHVAVIDPGVGTSRAAVAIQTPHAFFVGPDNGIFDLVLGAGTRRRKQRVSEDSSLRFSAWTAVRLTNASYYRPQVSSTFHGRDIFAPVAAHLARGVMLSELGEPIKDLVSLALPEPEKSRGGLKLHVLRADHFGNLITDLTAQEYKRWNPKNAAVAIEIGTRRIAGLSSTFADVAPGEPVAYFGSGGRLEIAVRNGDAAKTLSAELAQGIALRRLRR